MSPNSWKDIAKYKEVKKIKRQIFLPQKRGELEREKINPRRGKMPKTSHKSMNAGNSVVTVLTSCMGYVIGTTTFTTEV